MKTAREYREKVERMEKDFSSFTDFERTLLNLVIDILERIETKENA